MKQAKMKALKELIHKMRKMEAKESYDEPDLDLASIDKSSDVVQDEDEESLIEEQENKERVGAMLPEEEAEKGSPDDEMIERMSFMKTGNGHRPVRRKDRAMVMTIAVGKDGKSHKKG